MIITLSPFISTLIAIATAVGAYYLTKYVINPYFAMMYYKRQGAGIIWNWKDTLAADGMRDAVEKGQYYWKYMEYLRKHPGTRFIAENTGPTTPFSIIVADPEVLPEFLKKVNEFPKAPSPFTSGVLGDLLKGSIFFAERDFWIWKRKFISSGFSSEVMQNSIPLIIETTQQRFSEWVQSGNHSSQLLVNQLTNITSEAVGKLYYGRSFATKQFRGLPLAPGIKTLLTDLLLKAKDKNVEQDSAELKRILLDLIKNAEANPSERNNNLVGLYLNSRDRDPKDERLGNDFIIGESIGLMQAGTDTVACVINSAIYYLWKYPQFFAKVKAEIDQEFKDPSTVTIESLNRMTYTNAFLKETMRLGGPSSNLITRIALEDTLVDGFMIKKGTLVKVINASWHPFEQMFTDPSVFDPERFLSSSKYQMNEYAYIPFSTGPRTCLGDRFAMYEAKTVLSMFVKTFDFQFPAGTEINPLVPRFAFQPMKPLMISITPK